MSQLEQDEFLQDRYRIVKLLGGGGMGRVYLAHDTRLADKPCAIKELIPDPHLSPEEREQDAAQFRREAAVLAHLNHVNLPNVSDYFEERGHFYLVMDYVDGETLAVRLEQSPGGLPQETVVGWAMQLCDVLEYLHGQNPPVIFRDMKPSNVILTPEGRVKLIDFGVVRLFDPSKGTDTLKMGTAGYAPPEQYAGQGQTTPRSDIYALGATLYELLTGDNPTAHPFVFTPPRQVKSGISQTLSDVVMQAVSLDPGDRFPSARAVRNALQKVTRPRRFRLPSVVQHERGTGTAVMPSAAAIPRQRGRFADIALGVGRWLLRLAVSFAVAFVVMTIVFLLAGSFAIAIFAENAVATADWQLDSAEPGEFVVSEEETNEDLYALLRPYALDIAESAHLDFRPPDIVVFSVEIASQPVSLQARLDAEDGKPVMVLEKLNGVRLYVVGGIISGGVNRGIDKAWEDAPVRLTSIVVRERQVTTDWEWKDD
jgi:tRNA A-37 threonylcarbamoyl transferase component Bud32